MKHTPCGCGKRTYPTHTRAITAALTYTRAGAPPLRIYRCPVAGGFHLTKQRKLTPVRESA